MPLIFINFRGFDAIFDSVIYTKELSPLVLDVGDKIVKLLFPAEKFDIKLEDVSIGQRRNSLIQTVAEFQNLKATFIETVKEQGVVGRPEGNVRRKFYENTFSKNGIVNARSMFVDSETETHQEVVTFCVAPRSMCVVLMDAHLASCAACQIHRSRKFRRRFLKYLARNFGFKECVYDNLDFDNLMYDDYLRIPFMVDVISVWPNQRLDFKWDKKICELLVKKMLLEEAMAWLSTLGGGYSALGDYNQEYAVEAGRVALKQMKIAQDLGDPIMTAKGRLFWAQSRMQLGHLSECKKIIRRQYCYAKYSRVRDERLINMCLGIWSRLQFQYKLRQLRRIMIS